MDNEKLETIKEFNEFKKKVEESINALELRCTKLEFKLATEEMIKDDSIKKDIIDEWFNGGGNE